MYLLICAYLYQYIIMNSTTYRGPCSLRTEMARCGSPRPLGMGWTWKWADRSSFPRHDARGVTVWDGRTYRAEVPVVGFFRECG
jgi:hypothetical protein